MINNDDDKAFKVGRLYLNVFFITLIIAMNLSAFILWGYSEEKNILTDDEYPVIGSQNNPFFMLNSTESDISSVEFSVEKLNASKEMYDVIVIVNLTLSGDDHEFNATGIDGNFSISFKVSPEGPVEVNLTVLTLNLTDIHFHLQIKMFESSHPFRTFSYLFLIATIGLFILFIRSFFLSLSEDFVKEFEKSFRDEKREDQF